MNICYAINNGFEIGFGFYDMVRGRARACNALSSIIQNMLVVVGLAFYRSEKCLHLAVSVDLPAEFSELVHLNSIRLEGTSYSRLSDYQNKSVCKITSHTFRVGIARCVWDF